MDLQDQLKNLFPDHTPEKEEKSAEKSTIWLQDDPIICKYEKRKGKPITILEGYTGATSDFKKLAKELKTKLPLGGRLEVKERTSATGAGHKLSLGNPCACPLE